MFGKNSLSISKDTNTAVDADANSEQLAFPSSIHLYFCCQTAVMLMLLAVFLFICARNYPKKLSLFFDVFPRNCWSDSPDHDLNARFSLKFLYLSFSFLY